MLIYNVFFDIETILFPLFGTIFAKVNEILKIFILITFMAFSAFGNRNYSIRLVKSGVPKVRFIDIYVFFIAMLLIVWQMGTGFVILSIVVGLITFVVVEKWNIT